MTDLATTNQQAPRGEHVATDAVAGPCTVCGDYVGLGAGGPVHLIESVIFCGACCPRCNQKPLNAERGCGWQGVEP